MFESMCMTGCRWSSMKFGSVVESVQIFEITIDGANMSIRMRSIKSVAPGSIVRVALDR